MMLQIEKRYQPPYASFSKYEKIRIEQWCKKLCQVTQNLQWKKNRNLYGMLLLDQILNKKLGKPFIKLVPESSLPMLSPTEVKAQLSDLFKKFISNIEAHNKEQIEIVKEIEVEESDDFQNLVQFRPAYSATPQPEQKPNSPKSKNNFILIERGSVKKPPKQNTNYEISNKKNSEKKQTQNSQAVKSILKHKHSEERKPEKEDKKQKSDRKHKFMNTIPTSHLLSEKRQKPRSNSQARSIKFQEGPAKNSEDYDDLDKQFEGMNGLKVKFIAPSENLKGSFGSQTQDELCMRIIKGMENSVTVGDPSELDPLQLQNQVIKLKTDNEILNITLRHLQEELNGKSETIRKQQQELTSLRQTVLELQAENQQIKHQKQVQQVRIETNSSFEKENTRKEPPKPIAKPQSPRETGAHIFTSFGTDHTNHYQSQQVQQMTNIFKKEPSVSQENSFKPPPKTSQNFQFSPLRTKQSVMESPKTYKSQPSSKIARVNQILGKANQKLSNDFSSIRSSVQQNQGEENKKGVLESEFQMQQFNDEFNKIFNMS